VGVSALAQESLAVVVSPDAPPPLAETIRAAQGGSEAAFEELMAATQRRVAALAYRLLGSREEARDATQEVYLRVYRFLPRFRPFEDVHAWLYRVTVNVCRDLRRRRRAATPLPEADGAQPAALVVDGGAEESARAAQEATLLARALATLPEKERRAVVLRDLEGLQTADVARVLGSSPVTVRTQICSARKRLHAFLAAALGRARERAPGGPR
jgi:RNA polymerase sigma-70 factor (ECF subfamily)